MSNVIEGAFLMAIGKVMMNSDTTYEQVMINEISRAAVKLNMLALGISEPVVEEKVSNKEWDAFNAWQRSLRGK